MNASGVTGDMARTTLSDGVDADLVLNQDFATLYEAMRAHAIGRGNAIAIVDGEHVITYAQLIDALDRAVAALRADGLLPGQTVAICAGNSLDYVITYLGAVTAGLVVAPLSPSLAGEQLVRMLQDSGARIAFLDAKSTDTFGSLIAETSVRPCMIDASQGLPEWLGSASDSASVPEITIRPDDPFNIIYSSGTTGTPKGIVQSHLMRWRHVHMLRAYGLDQTSVTLLSTPLYSNTTLAGLFPTLACGGAVILMRKFDARHFLELSERYRVTHAMLVPLQFRRLMDVPDFDRFDLSSYTMKFAASAPFAAALKHDVLRRWPGGLVELYGATEGGGLCILDATEHPHKLDTVGRPYPGHDIRLIRDDGTECAEGEAGEVVGRSGAMMAGYYNDPVRTAEVEWFSPAGERYLRTGDIGRFDADGFLTLFDRKKDMIISGGLRWSRIFGQGVKLLPT